MKKTTSILLVGMLIATVAGVGIVSAAVDETGNTAVFEPMYKWAGNHMRNFGAYTNGFCPGFGYYATSADMPDVTIELEVGTAEEAVEIAEETTGQEISENNVYQMGRWWVFYYTDDEDAVKQGRIDAFTGEVIEDFYQNAYNGQQYRRSGRYGYGGGCAGAGYRY